MALALHIVAIVMFCLAAANLPVPKVGLGWLGMAFWALSEIVGGFLR